MKSGIPLAPGEVFDPSSLESIPDTGKVVLINVNDSTLPFPAGSKITHLRIYEVLLKTTYHRLHPRIGYSLEDPARRILGTVPVEPDGSAYFTVPADTPIFFQALDANGMAVQGMRSLTYVKPGETLTCAGCHEPQGKGSMMDRPPSALLRDPSTITPIPYEGANPFSFPRLVQPVFNEKCVTCHAHQPGGSSLDLTKGDYGDNFGGWYTSYTNLLDFGAFNGKSVIDGGSDNWNPPRSTPGDMGAFSSRLYKEVLSKDHYGLNLSNEELLRITLWLDSNSDFYGAYNDVSKQGAGEVIQPIDPRVTEYLTVTNTDYSKPAIPISSNSTFEQSFHAGTAPAPAPAPALALYAPLSGGALKRPISLGARTIAGQQAPVVEAGEDTVAFVGSLTQLRGSATIGGNPAVPGTFMAEWSFVRGPIKPDIVSPNNLTTPIKCTEPGSYILRLTVSTGTRSAYDDILVTVLPENKPPLVDAGADLQTSVGLLSLKGQVYDEDSAQVSWTQVGGSSSAAISNKSSVNAFVNISEKGIYRFRLTANDGMHTAHDDRTVRVGVVSETSLAPTTSAGPDIQVDRPNRYINLVGSVSSSGSPAPLSTVWSVVSGPGTVTFTDAYAPATTASFSTHGAYLLQLTADNGFKSYDQMVVIVFPGNNIKTYGSVTWECWNGIGGRSLNDLTGSPNFPDNPDETRQLKSFKGPSQLRDNYGTRVQGYVIPRKSGNHTFYIASDDDSELRLSSDMNPGNAVLVASVSGWTYEEQWERWPSQKSAPIWLDAGQPYYIEVLYREGGGDDHMAVGWTQPDTTAIEVIGCESIAPFPNVEPVSGELQYDGTIPYSEGPVDVESFARLYVSAGTDQTVAWRDETFVLRGTMVANQAAQSAHCNWSKVGGAGSVTFTAPNNAVSGASFSEPGDYLLQLEASTGTFTSRDRVHIRVEKPIERDYLYPSPQETAWSTDGALLSASDLGLNRVAIIDTATRSLLRTVAVEGRPHGMAWVSANQFWVCEYDAGTVALVDAKTATVKRRIEVGPKPYDVKYDFSRDRLVVTEHGRSEVWVINASSGEILAKVPVENEPMYLELSSTFALVANNEPKGDAREPNHGAVVNRIDLNNFNVRRIALPPGSSSLRGMTISSDGRWAYVAHLLGRVHLPTTQLNDGWVFNNVVTVLDLASNSAYSSIPLDAPELGSANPWGVAEIDGQLWVVCSGGHELIALDLAAIHDHLATSAATRENMHYDLLSLYENDWITRYKVPGKGPRGMTLSADGETLAIATYFGGSVCLFDIDAEAFETVRVGPSVPAHALRRGEQLYYDAEGCFQRWLSCASCHPNARADGLNWDLLNDGIGNPKNTLSHLFSTATAPSMATGVRPDVKAAITAGFKYIQFQQRSDQEMQDVFDYLASIRPERSPKLNKQWMTSEAIRGKTLFNDPVVKCANCHRGPHFTDQRRHPVGTQHSADTGDEDYMFDTPSLREIWRNAPYLHDGSAPTLRDVLTTQNPDDEHGVTSHLSETQLDELVAYLEQISGESEWVNQAPIVDAGEDQVIVLPDNTVSLAATATDEGLPNSKLDVAWQLGEGPAAVQFSDADRSDSIAQFSGAGDYYLECVANDGDLATTNSILVLVLDTVDPDDTDLDRMSDTWENHYFKGTDKPKGAADEDWDNDGMSNRMEYIAGSDPTDGVGYHINISSADGNVIAEFSAPAAASTMAAGIRYFTLQRADPSTLPLQWINVSGYTDITGADQLVQWQDTSDQAGLFRVVVRLEAR